MMDKEISIEEIKKRGLEILKYIDGVCRENNIKYTLISGSLLGAIRHKGFIPWDDDIDIAIFRDDYNKLLDILKKNEKDSIYKVLSNKYDKNVYYTFSKVVDTKTKVIEKDYKIIENNGIWVDIFPIDNVNMRFVNFRMKVLRFINAMKNASVWSESNNNIKKFRIINFITKSIGHNFFICQIEKISQAYNKKETQYIGPISVAIGNTRDISHRDLYNEYIDVEFENNKFMAIKRYDELLTIKFGDYMQLPPKDKRIPHKIEAYWR